MGLTHGQSNQNASFRCPGLVHPERCRQLHVLVQDAASLQEGMQAVGRVSFFPHTKP